MRTEVNPQDTTRAEAFQMWMTSPMPMVTLTKTFDVSNLLKASRKLGMKFNALLCWCIGKAATQMEEFYLLPDKDKLYKFDDAGRAELEAAFQKTTDDWIASMNEKGYDGQAIYDKAVECINNAAK